MGDKKAVVFGSSAPSEGDAEYKQAYEVGKMLGELGFDVVNGGFVGTMEASSRGAKDGNAKAIGVVPKGLDYAEPNKWLDEVVETENIVRRVDKMLELGDVFIVLKGSIGTMHELATAWNLMSIKIIEKKPIICLGSHWKPVVEKISETERHKDADLVRNDIVRFADDIDELKRILEEIK
jgi:uncharacterized protein (TIGR00730 family)